MFCPKHTKAPNLTDAQKINVLLNVAENRLSIERIDTEHALALKTRVESFVKMHGESDDAMKLLADAESEFKMHCDRLVTLERNKRKLEAAQTVTQLAEKTKRPKRKRRAYEIHAVSALDKSPLTDTAVAYLDKAVSILCWQSLTTNFSNSGNPRILKIMQTQFASAGRSAKKDYEEIIQNEYDGKVKLMKIVTHSYKIVAGVRIPIDESKTLELTDAGREYLKECNAEKRGGTETTITFDDYRQNAWVAIMELNKLGLLTSFDSIWNMSRYIYQALRKLSYVVEKDKDKDELFSWAEVQPVADKAHDELVQIENLVFIENCKAVVMKNAKCRNKELAWKVWLYRTQGGLKVKEACSLFGLDVKQIDRYTKAVATVVAEELKKAM